MSKYILDACALITLLNKETGFEKIRDLMTQAESGEVSVCVNIVNLLEVYYDRIKTSSVERADAFLETTYNSCIEVLEHQNKEIIRTAGKLKANYKMSLADSFALATAVCQKAVVVTCDHHEFDIVEQNECINFLWLR